MVLFSLSHLLLLLSHSLSPPISLSCLLSHPLLLLLSHSLSPLLSLLPYSSPISLSLSSPLLSSLSPLTPPPSSSLSPTDPLAIATEPENLTVIVGYTANFTCVFSGYPAPYSIQWFQATNNVTSYSTISDNGLESTLSFEATLEDDGKGYYCIGYQELVTGGVSVTSQTAILTVQGKALVINEHHSTESKWSIAKLRMGQIEHSLCKGFTLTVFKSPNPLSHKLFSNCLILYLG